MRTRDNINPALVEFDIDNLRRIASGDSEINLNQIRTAADSLEVLKELLVDKLWNEEQARRRAELDKQRASFV
jgi:hypothetical protein